MTPEQREVCRRLAMDLRGMRHISKEEFLRLYPAAVQDGKLARRVIEDAFKAKDADALDCALLVGSVFGFTPEHTDILSRLIDADWHHTHEDVVSALDKIRIPDVVRALFRATQWIPEYLNYDENRALAVRAIWAIGKIGGPEAERRLEDLARSADAILRDNALKQLNRLRGAT